MKLKLDTVFHILFFSYEDIHVSWGISERITDISLLNYYEDGCLEFNTNIGMESIDLIYDSENLYTKSQLNRLTKYLKSKDPVIEIEVIK